MTDAAKEMLELAVRLVIAADILKRHLCEVVYLERDCRRAAELFRSAVSAPPVKPDCEIERETIERCAQTAMSAVLMFPTGQVDASEFCDFIQDEIVASIRSLSEQKRQK